MIVRALVLVLPAMLLALHAAEPDEFLFQDPDQSAAKEMSTRELEAMAAPDALHYLLALQERVNLGPPEQAEKVLKDAASWTARNPAVAAYYGKSLARIPVSRGNETIRKNLFANPLGSLPAEWTIRLLADQLLDERKTEASTESNAAMADRVLLDMHLADWYQPDPALSAAERLKAHRAWVDAHRDRFAEIATATWGNRAVLNSRIGLGPDNQPHPVAESAPRNHEPKRVVAPIKASGPGMAGPFMAVVGVVLAALLILWRQGIRARQRA